jgi:hypothetical protein
MLGLWPGGKELLDKKHRPIQFRISNCGFRILGFSFSIRIPQSTIRNSGERFPHSQAFGSGGGHDLQKLLPAPKADPSIGEAKIIHRPPKK